MAYLQSIYYTELVENFDSCGAFIVDPSHLITAAHCLDGVRSNFTIIVGEINLPDEENLFSIHDRTHIRSVKSVAIHEMYYADRESAEFDIGIIKLESPLTYDANIQPICLPIDEGESTFDKFSITGWGLTEDDMFSGRLKAEIIAYLSRKYCALKFNKYKTVLISVYST